MKRFFCIIMAAVFAGVVILCVPVPAKAQEQVVLTTVREKAPINKIVNVDGGVRIFWDKNDSASGYRVYRRHDASETWKKQKTYTSCAILSYKDTSVKNGTRYEYLVEAYWVEKTIEEVQEEPQQEEPVPAEDPGDDSGQSGMDEPGDDGSQSGTDEPGDDGGQSGMDEPGDDGSQSGTYDPGDNGNRAEPTQPEATDNDMLPAGTDQPILSADAGHTILLAVSLANVPAKASVYKRKKQTGTPVIYLSVPSVSSLKTQLYNKNKSVQLTAQWTQNSHADGYQIQYASNRAFLGKKTVKCKGASTATHVLTGLPADKTWYVRVRAYKKTAEMTVYSAWAVSSNAKSVKRSGLAYRTYIKKKKVKDPKTKKKKVKKIKKNYELRAIAGQKTKGYDTVQGITSDGTYLYYTLYNRALERCRIAKISKKGLQLVMLSDVLPLIHGNDITYNADRKCLVVNNLGSKKLTLVDTETLTVTSEVTVALPEQISGVNKETLNKVTGFSAICYNAQRNQYAALPKNSSNFLILNADFEPVRMIGCSATGYLNQGIECKGDYIFRALSPKKRGQRQAVAVYDWEGKYYGRIDLATGYELETIFFSGNKMYAGLYRSYYKTTYKTVVTEKKVKVKGKKKKQLKKVKEKIPVTKLVRDNYIAKVKTF